MYHGHSVTATAYAISYSIIYSDGFEHFYIISAITSNETAYYELTELKAGATYIVTVFSDEVHIRDSLIATTTTVC